MPKLKRGISQRSLIRSSERARIFGLRRVTLHQKKNAEKVKAIDRQKRKKWRSSNREKDNLLRAERRCNSQVIKITVPPYMFE